MSVIHIVKVTGKNRNELIKALQGAIRELGGDEVPVSATDFYTEAAEDPDLHAHGNEVDDEEMEDVASPFGNQPPQMGVTPQPEKTKAPKATKSSSGPIGEVDSEGLPWDKRIHSKSREKIANGTWRKRRGLDDQTYFNVKNELRGQVGNSSTATGPSTGNTSPAYQAPAQPTHTMSTPVNQPPMQQPPMPPTQGGHTLQSFKANFAHVISALITEGKLSPQYVQDMCNFFGIPQIWMANPEQQEICFNEFVKYGTIQRVG